MIKDFVVGGLVSLIIMGSLFCVMVWLTYLGYVATGILIFILGGLIGIATRG